MAEHKEQNMRTRLRNLVGIGATLSLIGVVPIATGSLVSAVSDPNDTVFISEIHYDNAGTDAGEAVEVFGPTCTDLSGWSIEFYNGSSSQLNVYATASLSGFIPDQGSPGTGFGTVSVAQAGIQNGSPDGLALVDDTGSVRQFFSYEGTFVPTSGTAAGLTPTELPVTESSATPLGDSLQLQGSGATYGDFTWTSGEDNFGELGKMEPVGVGGDPTSCATPDTRFNELHYDNAGADANEAIEVIAPAGTDLAGWSIVLYNGSNGESYNTTALSGVVADQGGGNGVVSVSISGIQNGAPDGMALVDAGGVVVEFLSYEGSFTAVDGPAAGITSSDIGAAEGSSTLADQSLQRDDAGAWDGPFCNSFGELNAASPDVLCPTPAIEVKIHEIQGETDAHLLDGQRVIVEGVVVGDQEGPAPALRGFFVQEEDADQDGNPLTSEGIFVFNFNNDDVEVGDLVRVEGTVGDFNGNTQLTDFVVITPLGTAPLPTATEVEFPIETANTLEEYEAMLVRFPQTLVISEYFNYDRFGDVVVALPAPNEDRPYNPTSLFGPDTQEALDRQDLNQRSRITIDDGLSFQNVDTPVHPINRQLFSQDNSFRGGDQVTGLTGPLYEAFSGHTILPLVDGGYDSYVQTEQPAAPDDVGGGLTIATLNALNYFLTLDYPSGDPLDNACGPNADEECRGADDAGELDRQRVKLLNALVGLDADVIGMVELENTVGVEALADLASGLNDRLGPGTYDYVAAGDDSVVGPDVIKVGILYRPAAVKPIGETAILDTQEFLNPNQLVDGDGNLDPKNRAAVAASFVDKANGGVFSVVVNHLKSKGSPCGPGDDHPLAGSCNDTRTKAAQELANWLETDPTGVDDDDWLIIGDLNSYDKEDPISLLTGEGFTDLIAEFVGEFAYSFVFSGEFGYLDYTMSSGSMTPQVTGATEWHINADEADVFDYDTTFKSDYQDALFDPTTPFRASDHDAALVGVDLTGPDADIVLGAAIDEIEALRDEGVLNHGQARSMIRLIEIANRQIDRGRPHIASALLAVVDLRVHILVQHGVLTEAQGDSITCYVDAVRAGL
jgi:predicted extracellular nuclease